MDTSRLDDMKRLHRMFTDPNKPESIRRNAHRSFENIKKQLADKKLAEMRHRLILAIRANDTKYIEKFEQQIDEYTKRRGYANK